MSRPRPTTIVHFTHLAHLQMIAQHGLLADAHIQPTGFVVREAGDPAIKSRRNRRLVGVGPGGVVADYVPFYFAPRSPMMFKLHKRSVPSFGGSVGDLVYLVTTVERVTAAGGIVVLTDRNAAKSVAAFAADPAEWDDLVDWPLMQSRMWKDTSDDPERKERRMAECLVHRMVPWGVIDRIVVKDAQRQARVAALLSAAPTARVDVDSNWYF